MPKPKTATLTLEIVNDDGSKTVVTTADLDASRLPGDHIRSSEEVLENPSHILLGMEDPYRKSNYDMGYVYDYARFLSPVEDHFALNLRLPAVEKGVTVYTITEIEAPLTRVVMCAHRSGTISFTKWTEEDAQKRAEEFPHILYFFLDIP
jgi:hypothetical protein